MDSARRVREKEWRRGRCGALYRSRRSVSSIWFLLPVTTPLPDSPSHIVLLPPPLPPPPPPLPAVGPGSSAGIGG